MKQLTKEASETNNQFVTEERAVAPILKEYDYDALMDEFSVIVGDLLGKDQVYCSPHYPNC